MENPFWKAKRVFARVFESLNTISSTSRFVVDERGRGRRKLAKMVGVHSCSSSSVCPPMLLGQNMYVRKV